MAVSKSGDMDTGSNMKEAILDVLSKSTDALKPAAIAKLVGKNTAKDVNRYLYELQTEKKAAKVKEQPPLWISGNASEVVEAAPGPLTRSQTKSTKGLVIEKDTRISELPYAFLEAAKELIVGEVCGRNWECFAGKVGLSLQDIAMARTKSDPVSFVITGWQTQREATFGKFVSIMTDMDRDDVLCALKIKLQKQLGASAKEILGSND
jgi:hypothetical protein